MKTLLFGCVVLTCSFVCLAQTAPTPFKFGAQTILMPTPAGFINQFGKDAELTARLKATMESNNELLAVYVTKDDVARRQRGAAGSPGFYACLISMKNIKDNDTAPQQFSTMMAEQQKPFTRELDPKNKEIISIVDKIEKGEIKDPITLGWYDKQPDSFSAMVLGGTQFVGVPIAAATTLSFVLVKKRIVYLMVFRIVNDMNEVVALTDFTKKWAAQIKAANK